MKRNEPFDELLEAERYELDEPPAHRFDMPRREFVGLLGAGLLVSTCASLARAQELPRERGRGRRGPSIGERLHIGADGVITLLTGKVEVGQGSRTQLTMAAAEELQVPAGAIRLVMADSALVPDDGGTSGSRTTPSTVPHVRRACAAARRLLIEAAAREWQLVETGAVRIEGAKVVGPEPGQEIGLGDVVARLGEEGLDREIEPGVEVTSVAGWKVLGTSLPKVGAAEIVTGAHRYPSDIVRPSMLYGKVLRPPGYGAKLVELDLSAAKRLEGVTALRDGDFAGVAAPTSEKAREALAALAASARWESAPHPSSDELYDLLAARASGSGGGQRRDPSSERGAVEEGLAAAAQVLRATYHIAYIQHAPMEPRAAVAEWQDGALTVWTGTQNPDRVRGQLAEAFRLAREKVRVIVPDTGGGFGGKHTGEAAVEAARLALEARQPVSLQWTREEEFTWAYFRPAGVVELAGGLSAEGSLVAWEHININSGGSAVATPYQIPNARTRFRGAEAPLRQGSYRALAATANVFARECFMDELAAAAGAEPLEFRRRHLGEGRLRAVLEEAAKRFGWERRRQGDGAKRRGIGLACGTEKGSYVAACAEVEVEESGRFRVLEVVQAYECGKVHNPANLQAQVEGCLIQGLGGALWEEIRFRGGRITNAGFGRYRVPRFRDLPRIEVVLSDRPDLPAVGGSETPIIAVAPAIGNALARATGERLRSLPLRGEKYRSV
jgi:CO/xanthine dehydrogenase Mo-binding subunit